MPAKTCDILIQAGHENTPDGATGGVGPLGNEIDWTPIVANEAVDVLRSHGVDAVKEDASIKNSGRVYRCKLAAFVHFDDPARGESGPSVGYSHDSDRVAAAGWKQLYAEYWPFPETWHPDNYTDDEHYYYGFGHTITTDAEFLIEFGDLMSPRQAEWMKPRLRWLGRLLAHYLSKRSGLGQVPLPAPFGGSGKDCTLPKDPLRPPKFILKSKLLGGHRTMEEVASNRRVLRNTGGRVEGAEFVQDALNTLADHGHPAYRIPLGAALTYRGYYGPKTEAAVRAFQNDQSLEVDGVVGIHTILAMDAALLDLELGQTDPPTPPDGDPQLGGPALRPAAGASVVGTPAAFSTDPAKGIFHGNSSKTMGLGGVSERFSDGTIVREAHEILTAVRNGESFGPRRVLWRQTRQGKVMIVEQSDYCWDGRSLPTAILREDSDGITKKAPKGFSARPVETRKSAQFGKFDPIDEGTGSEAFGVTQTNSDVFGASVKKSRLIAVFGKKFDTNPDRLGAFVEIYHTATRRYACVPLVDVGPGFGPEHGLHINR